MKIKILALLLSISLSALAADLNRGTVIEVDSLMAMALTPDLIKHAGPSGVVFAYSGEPSAVRYVSFDGKTTYRYDLNQVPPDTINPFRNYSDFASNGSATYVLWNWNPDPHMDIARCSISRFDINGQYRGTFQLDGKYEACYALGLMGNDQLVLLAAGLDGRPFTGVYQTNGQFIKRIELPNDLRVAAQDKDPKKLEPLEVRESIEIARYESYSHIEDDGAGNLIIIRQSSDSIRNPSVPTVLYQITRGGEIKRFKLEPPKSKYGRVVLTRPFSGRIVVLGTNQDDASEPATGSMRVYDWDGKLVSEYRYVPHEFGYMLLDWNERRALFGTQAGDPNLKVKHFGIIEAIP